MINKPTRRHIWFNFTGAMQVIGDTRKQSGTRQTITEGGKNTSGQEVKSTQGHKRRENKTGNPHRVTQDVTGHDFILKDFLSYHLTSTRMVMKK